ncbi:MULTISPECIES: hypothetical protein [unclassified Clostridium]|uniref:hypothetical protein n=1 Tax=unclassified Clostridium TaxID=2614128 RepID=UPI00207A4798|nr:MULTISPECIES: hypothetical protein [unclassified Clostridium]
MNIGEKIQFTKAIRLRCVLKAKTGQTGIIEKICNDKVQVKLTDGELIETNISNIKPYKKKEKFNIHKATNEELLDKFEMLVAHQWQTINTHTKTYEKILIDIEKIRIELLKRLNE